MDRGRRVAGRSFKEPIFDANELVEGEDDDDADEDYDVESLLDMRSGDYEYGRSVSVAEQLSQEGGSSSSTGWIPVPQHQFPPRTTQPLSICRVENCIADMSNAKQYHKRHKVCEFHAKAQISIVDGLQQRFCQQCSR